MPTLDIDENIKQTSKTIEQMTQEVFRLQGVLKTFMNFKKAGLETSIFPMIQMHSRSNEELESIQENPE